MTVATEYFVKDEHTLCYRSPGMLKGLAGILASNVLWGGSGPMNGMCAADPEIDNLRPATLADFERFRVCPKGHLHE